MREGPAQVTALRETLRLRRDDEVSRAPAGRDEISERSAQNGRAYAKGRACKRAPGRSERGEVEALISVRRAGWK